MIINITAVFAATVLQMVLGTLWYGPLFGKPWMKLVGFTQEDKLKAQKKGMGKTYALAFLSSFVVSYVFAQFIFLIGPYGALSAVQLGFWVWLGFVAPVMYSQVLWVGKSVKLYALDSAYYLVTLILMSLLLTFWR